MLRYQCGTMFRRTRRGAAGAVVRMGVSRWATQGTPGHNGSADYLGMMDVINN